MEPDPLDGEVHACGDLLSCSTSEVHLSHFRQNLHGPVFTWSTWSNSDPPVNPRFVPLAVGQTTPHMSRLVPCRCAALTDQGALVAQELCSDQLVSGLSDVIAGGAFGVVVFDPPVRIDVVVPTTTPILGYVQVHDCKHDTRAALSQGSRQKILLSVEG